MQFLAKLSRVLRLSALEQIGVYHLAFPEVYEAYTAQRHVTIPLPVFEDGNFRTLPPSHLAGNQVPTRIPAVMSGIDPVIRPPSKFNGGGVDGIGEP